ncbi:hypothetical protein SprV_ctg2702922700 [Sparganum proliferum]
MCGDSSTSRPEAEYIRGSKGGERAHDPDFRGPAASRSCTDVFCCIVFLVFIVGLAVVAGWTSVAKGYTGHSGHSNVGANGTNMLPFLPS